MIFPDRRTYRSALCLFHALTNLLETLICKEISAISGNRHCCKVGSSQVSFSERVGVLDILGVTSFGRNPDLGDFFFDVIILRPAETNQYDKDGRKNEEIRPWRGSHVVKEPRLLGRCGWRRRCHVGFRFLAFLVEKRIEEENMGARSILGNTSTCSRSDRKRGDTK
jgi:hypothetical protein